MINLSITERRRLCVSQCDVICSMWYHQKGFLPQKPVVPLELVSVYRTYGGLEQVR